VLASVASDPSSARKVVVMPANTKRQVRQEVSPDRWARWVLERRFGGSARAREKTDAFLSPIRARVMAMAGIQPGDTVLDIASRDGYLGLAALEHTGDTGTPGLPQHGGAR
jgi:hypothetical protein